MHKNIFLRFWMPVIAWMSLIFVLSSIPGDNLPSFGVPGIDKIVHFSEFFILGFLLARAFLNSYTKFNPSIIIALSIAIAFAYALIDEAHQYFVPDRTVDFFDLLSDFIGASAGIFIFNIKRINCRQ